MYACVFIYMRNCTHKTYIPLFEHNSLIFPLKSLYCPPDQEKIMFINKCICHFFRMPCMYVYTFACICVCMQLRTFVCTHGMYLCMYVCIMCGCVCMHVCITCSHTSICADRSLMDRNDKF